jgi:hypothetical protein
MHILYFIIGILAVAGSSYSQTAPVRDPNTSASLFNGIGDFRNSSGQSISMVPSLQTASGLDVNTTKKVVGSAYINNDWCTGYIKLNNGAVIDSMKLKYNAYKEELYFIDRERVYVTRDSYSEFGFKQVINEQVQAFVFKNNFPAIGKNTAKTNYQFLTGSAYQLLKLTTKELTETTGLDGQSYFKIIDEVNYYVYRAADNSIRKIKKGISQLQTDLPELKDQIGDICSREKIKCKTEPELIILFSLLKEPAPQKPF